MKNTKIYIPLNIQRFASGVIELSVYTGSANVTFQGKIEWESVSNGSTANTSTVYCTLYARKQNSSSATTGKSWSGNITIDGTPSTFSSLSSSTSIGNNWVKVHSFSKTVSHNSDGTKTITISGSVKGPSGTGLANAVSSGSKNVTLDTIPRYATITSFTVNQLTETSVRANWSVNANCNRAWCRCKPSSSGTWGDWILVGWPNFDFGGLIANTKYDFQLRVERADSLLLTDSSVVQQTTYDYPKPSNVTDFIIGNGAEVKMYNPLGRTYTLELISNSDGSVIGTYNGNYAGIVNAEFKTSDAIDKQYKSIPNSPSGTYYAKVTYNGNVRTSVNKTYTVNYEDCKPIFTNFTFEDVNEFTLSLTKNPNILVDGYSTVGITIDENNKATGTKYASITNYNLNGTLYPYADNFYQEIPNFNGNSLKVFAVDSRGNEKLVEKSVSLIGYQKISKGTSVYSRGDEGVGTQVTFEFNGKFWANNFGDVDNKVTATYKFKKTGETNDKYVKGTTEINVVTDENGNYNFSGILAGDTEEDSGFDVESSYDVVITVKDLLSSVDFTYVIIEGSPAMDLFGNSLALGGTYDEKLGGRVQIPNLSHLLNANIIGTIKNKNLFNDENYGFSNHSRFFSNSGYYSEMVVTDIEWEVGKFYTYSFDCVSSNDEHQSSVVIRYTDSTYDEYSIAYNTGNHIVYTFEIKKEVEKVYLRYCRASVTGNYKESTIQNVQIELGNEATNFQEHKIFGMKSGTNERGSYIKFEDGTLIQWGSIEYSANTNGVQFYFPIAFYDTNYKVVPMHMYNYSIAVASTFSGQYTDRITIHNTYLNTSNMTWTWNFPYSQSTNWLAIGRWKK